MRITRFTSLSQPQFFGCAGAFVDSLFGELSAALRDLRKLEGRPKGSAFVFEMSLDAHRYGALLVLDRWATLVNAFGPHLKLDHGQDLIDQAAARVQTAENILGRANNLLDAAQQYTGDLVAGCVLALESLGATFAEERRAAEQFAQLGPMLPEEYREARRIFLEDLAER